MKKIILAFGFLLLLQTLGFGQMEMATGERYKFGVGIRGGWVDNGLDLKYFLDKGNGHALEGIVSPLWGRIGATVLYEKQQALTLVDVPGLDWYFGIGGHMRYFGANWGNSLGWYNYNGHGDGLHLGIDAIIGLEYKFLDLPIAAGVDFKPFYELDLDAKGYIQSDVSLKVLFTLE